MNLLILGHHAITRYHKNNYRTYFDSSGVECISKDVKKFIGNTSIKVNIKYFYNTNI